MAWYSYFLMSVPEAITMVSVALVLYGYTLKNRLKQILIFGLVDGALAFGMSVYLQSALKPFITLFAMYLIYIIVFRFSYLRALVFTLTSFLFLAVFEATIFLVFVNTFPVTVEELTTIPWMRIVGSLTFAQIPMWIIIGILSKFKWKINLPSFVK